MNAAGIQYNGATKSTTVVVPGLFTVTVTGNKSVTITDVAAGVHVNKVVVKGGPAYNVYDVDNSSSWTAMVSPLNGGGNVPDISHWFACYSSSDDDSDSDDDDGDDDSDDGDDSDDEVGDDGDDQQSEAPTPEEQQSEAPVPEDKTESGALPLTGWLGSNLILGLGLAMLAAGGLAFGVTRRSAKS